MRINLDWLPLALTIVVALFVILVIIGSCLPDEKGEKPESEIKKTANDLELLLIALWFK